MPIAAFYVGLNALILIALSFQASRMRMRHQVSLGEGEGGALRRAIRAHGNAAEHMPLGLLILLASAALGAPVWVLHALGATLTLGRLAHAYALIGHGPIVARQAGMLMTYAVYIFGGAALMGHAVLAGGAE